MSSLLAAQWELLRRYYFAGHLLSFFFMHGHPDLE